MTFVPDLYHAWSILSQMQAVCLVHVVQAILYVAATVLVRVHHEYLWTCYLLSALTYAALAVIQH